MDVGGRAALNMSHRTSVPQVPVKPPVRDPGGEVKVGREKFVCCAIKSGAHETATEKEWSARCGHEPGRDAWTRGEKVGASE